MNIEWKEHPVHAGYEVSEFGGVRERTPEGFSYLIARKNVKAVSWYSNEVRWKD